MNNLNWSSQERERSLSLSIYIYFTFSIESFRLFLFIFSPFIKLTINDFHRRITQEPTLGSHLPKPQCLQQGECANEIMEDVCFGKIQKKHLARFFQSLQDFSRTYERPIIFKKGQKNAVSSHKTQDILPRFIKSIFQLLV